MVRWGSPETPPQIIKRQEDVNQAGRQIAKILIVVQRGLRVAAQVSRDQ